MRRRVRLPETRMSWRPHCAAAGHNNRDILVDEPRTDRRLFADWLQPVLLEGPTILPGSHGPTLWAFTPRTPSCAHGPLLVPLAVPLSGEASACQWGGTDASLKQFGMAQQCEKSPLCQAGACITALAYWRCPAGALGISAHVVSGFIFGAGF